jgi:hypothetical protein
MPRNRPCDFFLKTSRHVQVAVTVNSLPTPLLSPAHSFAAKGCEGGDRSDGRKQNFLGSVLFQNPSLHFSASPRLVWGECLPPSLGGFLLPYQISTEPWAADDHRMCQNTVYPIESRPLRRKNIPFLHIFCKNVDYLKLIT